MRNTVFIFFRGVNFRLTIVLSQISINVKIGNAQNSTELYSARLQYCMKSFKKLLIMLFEYDKCICAAKFSIESIRNDFCYILPAKASHLLVNRL